MLQIGPKKKEAHLGLSKAYYFDHKVVFVIQFQLLMTYSTERAETVICDLPFDRITQISEQPSGCMFMFGTVKSI